MENTRIVLGSGHVYTAEFDATVGIPEDNVLEVEENRIGYISGGATMEYKPTFYTAKDDLGVATKSILTEEEATFKTGVMTFNANTLAKLSSTGRVTEDSENGLRIIKIGGVGNDNGKKYVIHFVHKDPQDGDIRITIVGRNEAGFSLAFVKDKETVIDAEFKCQSMDDEGTLIIYKEAYTPEVA